MRGLATLHRWWGVAFCLLFAMWFASGIVMHFVPFPARHERYLPDGIDMSRATIAQIDYDQWTVAGDFNSDRPLKRIALNDAAGTEVYVSAASGKAVLITTRDERLWNYVGSVAHWLYPTELRHHAKAWNSLMWWLSLLGTLGAALGVVLGLIRLGTGPAYRGLQRWHHICGLIVAPFVLCWIFSGFLSMNDGLFAHSDDVFRAMHTFDFPPLASHPWLRTSAIVTLCLSGLAFSLTGVVLAWRRAMSRDKSLARSA
jgi:hypothetical protein